jgi:hypothetical protein
MLWVPYYTVGLISRILFWLLSFLDHALTYTFLASFFYYGLKVDNDNFFSLPSFTILLNNNKENNL